MFPCVTSLLRPLRRLACAVAFLVCAPVLVAQDAPAVPPGWQVSVFTTEQGLPTQLVKATLQDAEGFLWVGTDEGLVRFDGTSFEALGLAGRLPSPYVKALMPLPSPSGNGRVAVVTDGGVVALSMRGSTPSLQTLFLSERVNGFGAPKDVFSDRYGRLWVSGAGAVVRIDEGRQRLFRFPASAASTDFLSGFQLAELGELGVVAFSEPGAVFREAPEGDRFVAFDLGHRFTRVRAVSQMANGVLVVGDASGVWGVAVENGKPRVRSLLRLSGVTALAAESSGRLWVGTVEGEVFTVSPDGTPQRLLRTEGAIKALTLDREGSVWAGHDGGLVLLRRAPFASFAPVPVTGVETVDVDEAGRVYALVGDQVVRPEPLPNDSFALVPVGRPVLHTTALDASVAGLWRGLQEGALVDEQGRRTPLPQPGLVLSLEGQPDGSLWVVQHGVAGLTRRFPDGRLRRYSLAEGLSGALEAVVSGQGQLYALGRGPGTYLFRYDPAADRFVNLSVRPAGVPDNRRVFTANALALSPRGTWCWAPTTACG